MNQSKHSLHRIRASSPIEQSHRGAKLFDEDDDSSIESIPHDDDDLTRRIAYALMENSDESSDVQSISLDSDEPPPPLIAKYFESIEQCGENKLIKPNYKVYQEQDSESMIIEKAPSPEIRDKYAVKKKKGLLDFQNAMIFSEKIIEGYEVITSNSIQLKKQIISFDSKFSFYCTEVESPLHFWFHATDEFTSVELQLQSDYEKFGKNIFTLKFEDLEIGMLVACYSHEYQLWHRARVVEKYPEIKEVRVFYVDYGTVGKVKVSELKYLMKSYSNYPRYSNRGRIPYLQPKGRQLTWPLEDVEKFYEKFVSNDRNYAKWIRFDNDEQIYDIELFLPKSYEKQEFQSIRDWILENNHADALEPSDVLPFCYHFPNFDSLESTFIRKDERMKPENDRKFEVLIETNFLSRLTSKSMHTQKNAKVLNDEQLKRVKHYMENDS